MKHIILSLLLAALGCLTASADYLTVCGETVDIATNITSAGIAANRLKRGTITYYPATNVLEFDNVATNDRPDAYAGVISASLDGLTIRFKGTNDFVGNDYFISSFASFKIVGDSYSASVVNFTRGDTKYGQPSVYTVSNDRAVNLDIENVTLNITDNIKDYGIIGNTGSNWYAAKLSVKSSRMRLTELEDCKNSVINGFTTATFTSCSPANGDISYNTSKQALCYSDGDVVTDFELTPAYVAVNTIPITSANSAEGAVTAGVSYDADSKTLTLNNVNRSSGLMVRTNIDGLRIRLVGDNKIKHSYSSNSSFVVAEEGCRVVIDGENSGTLTIEHGAQGSYPMFNMYPNSTVEIRDVPAINITCGHVVMHGNINNGYTAGLIINHSAGKFTTTSVRFSNVVEEIAELRLVNAEIVTGSNASNKPYSSGGKVMEFRATDGSKFDVNSDGRVDVGDVNAVLAAILAGETSSKYNVNGDAGVDVGDVNAILEAILAQ
ncbi:MAG: hypothetical protein IJU62_03670 [Muribaculaceae bacterium]|nr:hypothetical protein [Muribaculaceae bacterium]